MLALFHLARVHLDIFQSEGLPSGGTAQDVPTLEATLWILLQNALKSEFSAFP